MKRLAFEPFVALQSQTTSIDAPAKFRYESGFSDTGLADNGERPPVPGPCRVPRIDQDSQFPITPDHGVADIARVWTRPMTLGFRPPKGVRRYEALEFDLADPSVHKLAAG